ncbi:alpha/beta hydrolase [Cohnella massiliensis]|uniref:alpha/beta hydrolase n=1 Tax=Cohnella massiliensis TaxID=1816691 RepID=UPI0009BBD62E|nr:alpha/beta hydrolase-fold protein [Cohnella massiliensis]
MPGKSAIVTIDGFYARRLNNERRIFVYLPPGYEEGEQKRYPVLYMHAGQRAFAPARPGTESWNIHEAADRLIEAGNIEEIIIVAIAHVRPVTSNEYYHFKAPAAEADHIACSGLDYEHFLIHDLKPYIDRRFRTLTDPGNTGLIGSSAGGLSTYHTGFRNPDVFGKLIMLSPYFVKAWLDETGKPNLCEETLYRPYPGKRPLKLWLDIGDAEGLFLPRHVRQVVDELTAEGYRCGEDVGYLVKPEAAHQEKDWGERAHLPLLFMFGRRPERIAALELHGRDRVGLNERKLRINAIARYDNGLELSLLDAEYAVADPDVLEVERDGTIVPKKPGATTVTLKADGLHAAREYRVEAELSEFVQVAMIAEIPPEPSPPESIYGGMGMKLVRGANGRYAGSFLVPRGTGYRFRFTRGFRKFETAADGSALPNRAFRADNDLVLHYKVERWEETTAYSPERRSHADPAF